jgi:2-phosphosulfolactate phosphatase
MGERKGKKLPGFDYGNSPTEIQAIDFSGKTVIQTTSAGTQGFADAKELR